MKRDERRRKMKKDVDGGGIFDIGLLCCEVCVVVFEDK